MMPYGDLRSLRCNFLRECLQLVENVSGVNPITAKWAEDLKRENDIPECHSTNNYDTN